MNNTIKQRTSSVEAMDQAIIHLRSHTHTWVNMPIREKIRLIEEVISSFVPLCDQWVQVGLSAKQAQQDIYSAGWEWGAGPMSVLRFLRSLQKSLRGIDETGRPLLPGPLVIRPNGQVSARIYPRNLYEKLSTIGTTMDIWMEPGSSVGEVLESQAAAYKQIAERGKVCLVLGAGNASCIPVNDSLTELFVCNNLVLLKMNPVNDYLGPLIETALKPLIDAGCFNVVYGGAEEGRYLCNHAGIDCLRMTGSDATYEAITFGAGEEGLRNKQEHHQITHKPFTAELGNIAPAIIVPGPWSDSDLQYQAEQIASHFCDTGSYSCSRTRLIVQHAGWSLRDKLLDAIEQTLSDIKPRFAYYPGAVEQHRYFVSKHPEARLCGIHPDGSLPWTLIPDVDPYDADEICFKRESFCPVMAEMALEADSPAEFIQKAVEFSNQRVWGTLSAVIIVHPKSLKDPKTAAAVEQAIEDLRYGIVSINCLPGLAFSLTTPSWGSYPGNPPWNIQSGTGHIHNAFMFAKPQKTVARGPFKTLPKPPWFPSRANSMVNICKNVSMYEAMPSLTRLVQIIVAALR